MTARAQKLALLAHITFSVGWFGAVAPYLALAIVGLASPEPQMTRAAYLSMNVVGWYVIVPFSLAALLTGLVQSLGTRWGLFRHWWIVVKFALTVFSVFVLLQHMQTVSRVARLAADAASLDADFRKSQVGLLIHPSGGLLVLLVTMILSVFKPWGLTSHGRRQPSGSALIGSKDKRSVAPAPFATGRPAWGRIIAYHAVGLAALFAVLHVAGVHHGR